jgi:hypothetical protein
VRKIPWGRKEREERERQEDREKIRKIVKPGNLRGEK